MSKRLRESVLASKKGRLLRAKATQSRPSMAPAPASSLSDSSPFGSFPTEVEPTVPEVEDALDALQEMPAREAPRRAFAAAAARPAHREEPAANPRVEAARTGAPQKAQFVPPPPRLVAEEPRSTAPVTQAKAAPFVPAAPLKPVVEEPRSAPPVAQVKAAPVTPAAPRPVIEEPRAAAAPVAQVKAAPVTPAAPKPVVEEPRAAAKVAPAPVKPVTVRAQYAAVRSAPPASVPPPSMPAASAPPASVPPASAPVASAPVAPAPAAPAKRVQPVATDVESAEVAPFPTAPAVVTPDQVFFSAPLVTKPAAAPVEPVAPAPVAVPRPAAFSAPAAPSPAVAAVDLSASGKGSKEPTSPAVARADEVSALTPPMGHIVDDALFAGPAAARSAADTAPAAKAPSVEAAAPSALDAVHDAAEEPPPSQKKAAAPAGESGAGEDDLGDASSPSGKFFGNDLDDEKFFRADPEDESIAPVVDTANEPHDHDEAEEPMFVAPSSDVIARRARLRRIVVGFVAFTGVLALAVVGKTVVSSVSSPSPSATPVVAASAPKPEAKPASSPAQAKPAPTEVAQAKPAETAAAEAKPEDAKADAPAEEAKPAAGTPDPERSAALQKETATLLNRGKYKDAMVKAREAIEADPAQAMPYLYLGSALQDTGKWKDGIEAYSECVRKATKGPVHECRQMGGKK